MIRINLLPDDCRRAEGTPLPRLVAILASVVVVLCLVIGNVTMFFRKLPEVTNQVTQTNGQVAARKKQVAESGYEIYLAKIQELEIRKTAISNIYKGRVEWARKFDQLVTLTPDYIGYEGMILTEPDKVKGSRNEMHGGEFILFCISRSTNLAQYSSFVSILQGSRRGPLNPATSHKGVSLVGLINNLGAPRAETDTTVATAESDEPEESDPEHFFADFSALKDYGWGDYKKKGYLPGMQFKLELVLKPREADKPKAARGKAKMR